MIVSRSIAPIVIALQLLCFGSNTSVWGDDGARPAAEADGITVAHLRTLFGKGQESEELQRLRVAIGKIEESKFDASSFWKCKQLGLDLRFDAQGVLDGLFLFNDGVEGHKQFKGLSGIDTRSAIENRIGKGKETYGGRAVTYDKLGVAVQYLSQEPNARIRHVCVFDPAQRIIRVKQEKDLRDLAAKVASTVRDFPIIESQPNVTGKTIVVKNGKLDSTWLGGSVPLKLRAESKEEVGTAVVVTEETVNSGFYTDGAAAKRIVWKIKLVDLSRKQVLSETSFTGPSPPAPRGLGGVSTGKPPIQEASEFFAKIPQE